MSKNRIKKSPSSAATNIGGNVVGSNIITGSDNRLSIGAQEPPAQELIDVRAQLEEVRKLLTAVAGPNREKIENAVQIMTEEAKKPEPEKDVIGSTLLKALSWAKTTESFVNIAASLQPHILSAAAWLGGDWQTLLHLK